MLMWSLDGTLRYLPIEALWDGKQYLLQRFQSAVFTPASLSRLADETSPDWTVLGLGVSKEHPGFTALPAVPEELRGIVRQGPGDGAGVLLGTILLDEAFTLPALKAALLNGYKALHIASHFAFRPGDETRSVLLLGDGAPLSLADFDQKPPSTLFRGVELICLSACDTAMGGQGADGREVDGLWRAGAAQRGGCGNGEPVAGGGRQHAGADAGLLPYPPAASGPLQAGGPAGGAAGAVDGQHEGDGAEPAAQPGGERAGAGRGGASPVPAGPKRALRAPLLLGALHPDRQLAMKRKFQPRHSLCERALLPDSRINDCVTICNPWVRSLSAFTVALVAVPFPGCPRQFENECLFLAPVANEDKGRPVVGMRVGRVRIGREGGQPTGDRPGTADTPGTGRVGASIGRSLGAAQQRQLRLPQRLDLGHTGMELPDLIEGAHQQLRALIRHRPQAGDHRVRALALRQHAKALDLSAVGILAAGRRVAGRKRQQVHALEQVAGHLLDLGQGEVAAVAKQQERVGFVAGPEGEVAGNMHDLVAVSQRRFHGGQREVCIQHDRSGQDARAALLSDDPAQLFGNGGERVKTGIGARNSQAQRGPLRVHVMFQAVEAGRGEEGVLEALDQVLLAVVEGGDRQIAQGAVQGPHQSLRLRARQVFLDRADENIIELFR